MPQNYGLHVVFFYGFFPLSFTQQSKIRLFLIIQLVYF